MLSLLQKRWLLPAEDAAQAKGLGREVGGSPLLGRLLLRRGLTDPATARSFLEADLSRLHDPFLMTGMEPAVARVARAVDQGERITVFADYDVDGVTSAALLVHFFRDLKAPVDYYLPDRLQEGYGVNPAALRRIRERGGALVITADCGVTAVKEAALARTLGLDLIITDHHQVGAEGVPDAVAVINPHQPGCPYPYRFLSGVGLVFKLAVGVRRRLHEHGWPAGRLPNLQQHLDLFGLGTIADLAPLTGENHLLSVHGLEAMRNTEKPGLIALKAVAGCTGRLDSFAVGFKLGPRLNAAGRLGKADAGFHLLVTEDPDAAMRLAGELDALNTLRKKTQDEVQEEAEYLLQREVDLEEDRVIVLESPNFHPGVIGIVASRLVEKHFRPVVLVAFAGGVGKGSARSIPSFHLHRAFTECADHLLQFGGHAYAAGLTIEKNRLEGFREALNAVGCRVLRAEHLIPEIRIDAEVTLKELDWELFREVRQLEPYGQLNPTPVFLARGTTCKNPRVIGKGRDHVRFTAGQGAARLEAVGFGMAAAWRGLESKDRLDLVFELHSNDFSGVPKLELKLLDLRPAP